MRSLIKNIWKARILRAFFFVAILTGCTTLESRIDTKTDIVQQNALQQKIIQSSPYPLFAIDNRKAHTGNVTNIYIEGDGYSWYNRTTVSKNPTPLDPVALHLMTKADNTAIYLARPCQYITGDYCDSSLWSDDRFSPEVIQSYMSALDTIKRQEGANKINLVGYSGGAYIALILSALRDDIQTVTTYAGLLDPPAWTRHHGVAPLNLTYDTHWLLRESLSVSFVHYCGTQDDIIPCSLNEGAIRQWNNHKLYRLKANHSNIGM